MAEYKLQRTISRLKGAVRTRYHITLPRTIIEDVARWMPGFPLNVEWIPKGEHFRKEIPHIVIYRPDSVWKDDR